MYISLTPEEYGIKNKAQAERMNRTLNIWLAHMNYDDVRICADAGIDKCTFWRYKHNKAFMDAYRTACHEYFDSLQAKAISVLEKKISEEDWQATKYVLEGTDYTSTQKVELNTDASINITINDGDD